MNRTFSCPVRLSLLPLVCLAAVACCVGAAYGAPLPPADSGPAYAPDRVIVKLTPEAAKAALGRDGALPPGLAGAMERVRVRHAAPLFPDLWPRGARSPIRAADRSNIVRARFPARAARAPRDVTSPDLENLLVLTLAPGSDVPAAVAELSRDPSVVYAEPDYRVAICATPNDPYYSSSGTWGQLYPDMWGLFAIKAAQGWDVTTGGASVVLAVVDTGVDYSHPDLAGRLWTNTDEIAGNGVDDDSNGFVDDTMGWDFSADDNDPIDGYGHGTHVSGTIAAATNNGLGVAGINWSGEIMTVEVFDADGYTFYSALAQGMRYAADNGADVMNNSWGGWGYSQLFQDAVNHAHGLGCIVVASAGNSSDDAQYYSPAGLRNVVCVAASEYGDTRAYFSNYGTRIDVAAPGVDILSLRAAGTDMYGDGLQIVGSDYYRSDGTSMASPHVVGALGLLIAAHPTWTTAQLVGQLVGTADGIDGINLDFVDQLGLGRINLQQALTSSPARKRMVLMGYQVDDSLGDDDGQPDAGEQIRLIVTVKHLTGTSPGVTATLSSMDPDVTVVTPSAGLGDLTGWRTASNTASLLVFDISPSWPGRRPVILKVTFSTSGYAREEEIRIFEYAGFGPAFPTLPSTLIWGATQSGSVEVANFDSVDWRASAGYQLLSYDRLNRWGVTSLPMTTDTYMGSSYYFDFPVVAPPVSTISYAPPVDPTAPGVTGVLPSAWEFCRGQTPMEYGLASQNVVISRFSDIQPGTAGGWARFYIEECAGRLPVIVGGYDDGTYRPAAIVDRASMAVFMSRALKLNLAAYAGTFTDVLQSHWAALYVEALVRAGIASGYSDGTYRPAVQVTRDAMAVFVARGMAGGDSNVPPGPSTATFPDVPTDHWAFRYVEYAVAQGVVSGYDTGTYRPTNPVDRGAMAVFMYRGFIQTEAAAVVLAGPAVTAINPATGGRCGWFSASSGPASDPGHAYVGFDAVRLGTALASGGSWDLTFELRQASAPETPATGAYTTTLAITPSSITAARNAALASGYPHSVLSWDISSGLAAGDYLLVVSVEDETGVMREVGRRPAFAITP